MFGNMGRRGKIYSRGMINTVGPDRRGLGSTSGERRACVCSCVLMYRAHNLQHFFLFLIQCMMGSKRRETKRREQIGKAAPLRRVSVALSAMLLSLIRVLKTQTGTQGTRIEGLQGADDWS